MITVEGVQIQTSIEALEQGQGFLVSVDTNWKVNSQDLEEQRAIKKAEELDIIGSLLNGHESTYTNAEATITAKVNQFESDITAFITDWNNGNYE